MSAKPLWTIAEAARALGLSHVGTLRAGCAADLVVLGAGLEVRRVMRAGEWI